MMKSVYIANLMSNAGAGTVGEFVGLVAVVAVLVAVGLYFIYKK